MVNINLGQAFLGVTFITVKLILIFIALGYFGTKAKEKTAAISFRTLIVTGIIVVLKILSTTQAFFFLDLKPSYSPNYFLNLFSIIVVSLLNIIYLRTGEYFADKRSLQGSLYLKGKFKFRNVEWKLLFLTLIPMVLWSLMLFLIFKPEGNSYFVDSLPKSRNSLTFIYLMLNIAIIAPLTEEIFFRHYILGLTSKWLGVGRRALVFNLLATSLFFSISHFSMLENNWIKLIQLLPVSVILGYVFLKKGLEHSVLLHSFFNVSLIMIFSLFKI